MATDDFFRARPDQMIDLRHPWVVLAKRVPWREVNSSLVPPIARCTRSDLSRHALPPGEELHWFVM